MRHSRNSQNKIWLLHQAALWDNAELLEDLLNGDELECLNARDSWGRTALHAAATNENSQCLRILTQAGADLDAISGPRAEGRTALHVAAEHGHAINVAVLVEAGANMLIRDHLGLTPLDLADKAEHTECMSVLRAAADRQEAQRMETFAVLQESCSQGDLPAVKSVLSTMDQQAVSNLINFAPRGNNTLLFRASENGHKEVVQYLLDRGADSRIHPVTKYSPLYIAAYNGKKEVVEVLLKTFPDLATVYTVEGWSPLHGACINGHTAVFELLLKYPYPKANLKTIRDGDKYYEVPFEFNLRDVVSGQTLLYMACRVGNLKIVEALLQYKVRAHKVSSTPIKKTSKDNLPPSPSKKISGGSMTTGIQALISKLRGFSVEEELGPDESWISPVDVNLYCNNGTETVLHHAVKKREHAIAQRLLAAGADPNLIIFSTESPTSSVSPSTSSSTSSPISSADERCYYKGSTCLVEACRNRDMGMIDLLIKYSARDDDCKALGIALRSDDEIVASKLLTLKAHQDPENGINKKGVAEAHHQIGIGPAGFASVGSLAYSSIFPSTAVMINWHDQGRLTRIKEMWLIDAAVRLNPKLRLSPKCQQSALHAITRLDLSNNDLCEVPVCIFQMQSLKVLVLSQNKLDSLPMANTPKKVFGKKKIEDGIYRCPWLEEIQLQDNRLEYIPPAIFSLKSLSSLDVSNNKLTFLPFELWRAGQLKELNVSFNLLSELPIDDVITRERSSSKTSSLSGGGDIVSLSEISQHEDSGDNVSETMSEKNIEIETFEKSIEELKSKRCRLEELTHHSLWSTSVDIVEKPLREEDVGEDGGSTSSPLQTLNLAHNTFNVVPRCLACLAPSLSRLNLSYNSLSKMGSVTSYPASLKHLDLSHNQIDSWIGENTGTGDQVCYAVPDGSGTDSGVLPQLTENKRLCSRLGKLSSTKLGCCGHKKHIRLENLRTLIMADNKLDRIQMYCLSDGDALSTISSNDESDSSCGNQLKQRIMFPALSMMDLSDNRIQEVPPNIHELANLSVLNLSGNSRLTELPPQMGLLQKLWNLNTRGCNLQEPLATMMNSKSYKTSDVIGYLRSVLENSKPYARLKLMVVGIQGIGKTTLLELLRQEGGSFKRKPAEHWAKRMGNKNVNMKTGRGVSISTVGVDIGDWTFEKKDRMAPASHGPVVFRTWDFGGQTEYYATHQYFLSKRSLYLVVWKITDGKKGMNEIQQWLINIQARAPNSPVIIVGTHLDVVKDEFPPSFSEYLQQKIREKFISVTDPEKCGLPKVLESVEVSCKSRQNMKLLANLLYDTAFGLRTPGSSTKLLEQKIPATYLSLEDVMGHLAAELRSQGHDPVLNHEQYESAVNRELQAKHGLKFRDTSELNQATKFLHENGVLLHYEDATLRDLYFLDPQWLCDMLSHVVTIREINPFARNGLMRLEDLRHVFKSSTAVSLTAKSYIVNLLNKFEVALTWDSRTLLIPSLLPTEQQMRSGVPGLDMRVKIPVRSRGFGFRGRRNNPGVPFTLEGPTQDKNSTRSRSVPGRMLLKTKDISKPVRTSHEFSSSSTSSRGASAISAPEYEMTRRSEPEHSIQRLVLMSYFPSGFWSRLLTRILADDTVVEIVRSYFIIPDEIRQDPILGKIFVEHKPEWVCWQTGLELRYLDATLFSMKQIMSNVATTYDYHAMKIVLFQDEKWTDLDTQSSSILEVSLPQDTVVIKRPVLERNEESDGDPIGYRAMALDPNPKSVCQLLALAVEGIDLLLEDWYPSLGTRFLHTSEGRMLVTRLVPCNYCLTVFNERETIKSWQDWSFLDVANKQRREEPPPRVSQESAASDRDSGMGQESPPGPDEDQTSETSSVHAAPNDDRVYAFLVEECILYAFDGKNPKCPKHGDLYLGQIAPDTVFLDLDDRLRIPQESVKRGGLIGRGAFGFVYEAVCRQRGVTSPRNVAIKMLQPIHPGLNASDSTLAAYKAGLSKWERDPLQYACKAYCTARQELNILIHLKHPHIVPLVGICVNPLSIVLELAPIGALDQQLKHYRRSGDKLPAKVVQLVILQIARALEYLHQQHIIYRDLKSENVLVWQMPGPFSTKPNETPAVFTKLADYGISRPTLPTGAKGFGGTEGFMAPEIVKYNGEEEYTEKVDCFSFGMFIYELLTLHQPFVGYETVKELILEGGRPPLTFRELCYPTYVLDLMVVCWSHRPRERPSASQIVSIASAPEFLHLADSVSIDQGACCASTVATPNRLEPTSELWLGCSSGFTDRALIRVLEVGFQGHFDVMTVVASEELQSVTSMCLVNNAIWIGDNEGCVRAYSCDTYELLFSYKMEPDAREGPSPVRSIHYLPELRRSCVAMHNGRMFLCNCDVIPTSQVGGEGTFLVTELGSSSCIHSLASIHRGQGVEIWCGESHGSLSVFTLTDGVVTSQEVVNHHDPVIENAEVLQIVSAPIDATDKTANSRMKDRYLWTFIYPGCHVYQWDAEVRRVKNKLDCSKLVPCSESLKTIAIDEHFSPGRCQVAAMTVYDHKLYIGTSWGCLIIAEAYSMRPITVFRPYSEEVQAIIPIKEPILDNATVPDPSRSPLRSVGQTQAETKETKSFIVTLGKGYRRLLDRYVMNKRSSPVEDDFDNDDSRTMFALLWRPDNWLSD